ncbi:MAG: DUF928 domain-containing protein [Pseudomonadota bacterium]
MNRALTFISCAALTLLVSAAAAQSLAFTPAADAPPVRVGGAARGGGEALALTILAPPMLADTASPRPTIYWHASRPVENPVEIVLIEEGGEEAIFETQLAPPLTAGRHAIALPESVRLTPGTIYQLSVAAVADAQARSNDVFASTLLRRRAAPTGLPEASRARIEQFAASGFWFDALHLLLEEPGDQQALNSLLEAAGLPTEEM